MKRVYTDDRFPGVEIVNNEGPVFEVLLNGKAVGTFESWENGGTLSEAFAGRQAASVFERWARCQRVDYERQLSLTEAVQAKNITSMQLDSMLLKEKVETNPETKKALKTELLKMAGCSESLPQAVVNHLLET